MWCGRVEMRRAHRAHDLNFRLKFNFKPAATAAVSHLKLLRYTFTKCPSFHITMLSQKSPQQNEKHVGLTSACSVAPRIRPTAKSFVEAAVADQRASVVAQLGMQRHAHQISPVRMNQISLRADSCRSSCRGTRQCTAFLNLAGINVWAEQPCIACEHRLATGTQQYLNVLYVTHSIRPLWGILSVPYL